MNLGSSVNTELRCHDNWTPKLLMCSQRVMMSALSVREKQGFDLIAGDFLGMYGGRMASASTSYGADQPRGCPSRQKRSRQRGKQ